MNKNKVAQFLALAGQSARASFDARDEHTRKLGAQLLLSEVLEFVIKGLGVEPEIAGVRIQQADELNYHAVNAPDQSEMLDGLCDVAYTMFWNSLAFGLPLEAGFDRVCDNNLEKFVALDSWANGLSELKSDEWHCHKNVAWPPEVTRVEVVSFAGKPYAVGKDARGKVRKPLHFKPVSFEGLL
ncbi:MAG: hypothetical protein K1X79_05870 [Oligoflexia bacterium]|nr:hypothetical protein [Oligoflexia bacterium]